MPGRRGSSSFVCSDFDLERTIDSGQVFRWRSAGGGFTGWLHGDPVRIAQRGAVLSVQGASAEAVRDFFSLAVDLKTVAAQIDRDAFIHGALERFRGLRVIRQSPWECAASFLLSSCNNIPRLTGMIDRLCARYGPSVTGPVVEGRSPPSVLGPSASSGPAGAAAKASPSAPPVTCGFPPPEIVAKVSERALRNLGLGYRAPHLRAAAQAVASGRADLERWRGMEEEELRRALQTIPGVGEKVAECVLLFAYGRCAAFPVDVWIGRVMRGRYFRGRNVPDRKIRSFARRYFGPWCGWAQQYLYCAARTPSA